MKIRSFLLLFTFLILVTVSASKTLYPAGLSACTWVTTSNGSGCSDNKDLYVSKDGKAVEIKSVSSSNSNQDSNKKAQSVAPPTVTQYIPAQNDNDTSSDYKVDQNTTKAEVYITTTPGQQISADVKTVNQTGRTDTVDGSPVVLESVGTTATVVEGANPAQPGQGGGGTVTALPTNRDCSDTSREFCSGVSNLYRCVPIFVEGQCNMRCGRTVDATCAQQYGKPELAGQEVGYVYVQASICSESTSCSSDQLVMRCRGANSKATVCVNREEFRTAELGGADGILINVSNGQQSNLINLENFYDAPTGGNTLFQEDEGTYYIKSDAGGGVFTMGESAGQTITSGSQGTSCSPGTNQTYYDSVGNKPTSTQRGGDRGACGQLGCSNGQQRLCGESGGLGTCARTDACAYQVQTVTEGQSCAGLQRMSNGEPGNGQFVGCIQGKNCFCNQAGSASSTVRCYADAGADSCGAAGGQPVVQQELTNLPPSSNPPSSNPPSSNPPASSPPGSSPQPGQCVSISKSKQVPVLGDQVSFSCATVTLAQRYEFRYAYTTAATVSENQYQTLQPTSATANTSAPITVDKVGRYVAMCRPCFANNQCEGWQVATLQEQN